MSDERNMMVKGEEDQVAVGAFAPTASREVAEVQSAMVIAKRFPRNQIEAMDRIKNACGRVGLARAATYVYSRGGADITGPSIRLAEAIAQNWGNLQYGIRELEQANGESVVEAYAWDVESNTRATKVFKVPHIRHTKKGSYKLEDSRDIYELVANQGARRLRACILGVIPGDVVEDALAECEKTLKASVKITPEVLTGIEKRFAEFGVTKGQIERRIQRRLDTIQPAQVITLGNIYNSLKDGMSRPEEWFEKLDGGHAADAEVAEKQSENSVKSKKTLKGVLDKGAGVNVENKAVSRPPAPNPAGPTDEEGRPLPDADDLQF